MKVKCINNRRFFGLDNTPVNLTLEKIYIVIKTLGIFYAIKDDRGIVEEFNSVRFEIVSEEKENKVEKETILNKIIKIVVKPFEVAYETSSKSNYIHITIYKCHMNLLNLDSVAELKDLIVALENLLKEIESEK